MPDNQLLLLCGNYFLYYGFTKIPALYYLFGIGNYVILYPLLSKVFIYLLTAFYIRKYTAVLVFDQMLNGLHGN